MPPLSDSLFGVDSGFRRAMFGQGLLLRVNVIPRLSANLLDGPAPEGQQVYIGHRPTFISGVNPIFTADLRQLHLHQAQLNIGFGWRCSSWEPAGPNTLAMTSLYLFKGWGDRRVEVKAGYIGNDLEFVGRQVGGSTSTGGRSRPRDVLSLIASYRNHSRYFTDSLVAQGATVWRSSSSLTGTYTLHVSRGDYLSLSLGYVRGPALSPRVSSAMVFTANWSLYL